jgi:hypothetical protein
VDKNLNVVGKPFRKVDARAKCVGQTKFADDIVLPRMLFCKILRSHVPHALIKSIDVSKALALPGVSAVITGKELPIPYGILPVSQDEHALCIDKVRFVGDPVAAVAAIDEDVAFDAMNLIEVEYEPLNTISSIEEAVLIDEPRIHDYGDSGNVHKKVSLEFGNVEDGFAEADLIREDVFFYEGNTHLPMEQHAAVARRPEADALEFDANAALRASRPRESFCAAGRTHPRDRDAKRRRVRWQERSIQPRSRRLQTRDDDRQAGKNHAHARRSFLLSSRTSSDPDESQDGCEERRRDHGDALPVVSRWWRLRQLWRGEHVLLRRVANRDL